MAIRTIIKDTDPQLRWKSRPVEKFDNRLATLLDDMRDTLNQHGGVGLAAPQVAILKRAFIIQDGDFYLECINPVILKQKGEQIGPEACLSVDNKQADIKRPEQLDVEYYDRYGKKHSMLLRGFHAVIFCHERDHLDGILFYDHIGE